MTTHTSQQQQQKILITSQGMEELKKEYEHLTKKKRPEAVERLAAARGLGDLSENSEYVDAKQNLAFIDGRIAELQQVLHDAHVISSKSKKNVNIGCKVIVYVNGKKDEFIIVGEWEANPMEKKISHSSPLGKALIGKKVGEQVEVEAPVGKVRYKILDIA